MKYFGYYNNRLDLDRIAFPAGDGKMSYIIESLCSVAPSVEVVSMCGATAKKACGARRIQLADNCKLTFFASVGRRNILKRIINRVVMKIQLWQYFLKNIRRGETVLVYHSLGYMKDFRRLRRIKKFKLILEMEEIYSDVIGNEKLKRKEIEYARMADGYIFPTQFLDELINIENKPSMIVHGNYHAEDTVGTKWNDGKVHAVYAGTFDPRKGGVFAAAAAAEFLPKNYHIHILGSGSKGEIQKLQECAERSRQAGCAQVTLEGARYGDEYVRFLQACDIGLSTQNPEAAFNATSFPSKVLSYMSNGLQVVSIRIPAIERSAVNDMIYYYDKQDPSEIAKVIMDVEVDKRYDTRERIKELHEVCIREMSALLREV